MNDERRAVIYARVSSSHDDPSQRSTTQQEADCRRWAEAEGFTVVEVYVDESISASEYSTKARPAFERLLRRLSAEPCDIEALHVWEQSRISRDLATWSAFSKLHRASTWELWVHGRRVEPETDAIASDLMAVLAAAASRETSMRVRRATAAARREGLRNGGRPPFGYDVVDGAFVVNEVEAAVVRSMFDEFIGGASIKGITDRLQMSGVKTKRGKHLHQSAVRRLLSNFVLAGFVVHEGQRLHRGRWEPIVTTEQVDAARARLDASGYVTERHTGRAKALAVGTLRCWACGSLLKTGSASSGSRGGSYVCRTVGCMKTAIGRALADEAVLQLVSELRVDAVALRERALKRAARSEQLAELHSSRVLNTVEWITAQARLDDQAEEDDAALALLRPFDELTRDEQRAALKSAFPRGVRVGQATPGKRRPARDRMTVL